MEPSERVMRRLAAIWSADIAGYSRLMGADDAGTFAEMRTRRELLRARVSEGGGRVVDAVGDNLMAEFPSAVDAVQCAIAAQEAFAARDAGLPESRRLPFRIGIDLGEVIVDGEAIAGAGVNVAARLCALAEPGGICISSAIVEQLRGKLEPELEDRGEQQLKNIAAPVRVYLVRGARRAGGGSPAAARSGPRPTLAVLPFANLGTDPEQEYLSDGIAEDLLTRLARSGMPVIARQSSFAYRGSRRDVREIGRELGARYLVEGSIRRAGDRIRLSAQLIDAETGEHVYAETFDRELGDVFALQDEITRAIAGSLSSKLSRHQESRAMARDPENLGASEALWRSGWHHNRYTRSDWQEARRFARRAIELEPRWARAHAMLSVVEDSGLVNDWSEDAEQSLAAALAAARRAIELEACDAGAHTALALARFRAGDTPGSLLAFERAVELEPENPYMIGNLGGHLAVTGSFDAAIPVLERAIALAGGTTHSFWHLSLATAHFGAHRDEQALACIERALQLGEHSYFHGVSASILAHLGRLEEARQHLAHLPGVRAGDLKRFYQQNDRALSERLIEGMRLAGMPD